MTHKGHIGPSKGAKGHIGSPKGHSGLWKRSTDNPVLPAYKYLDFLCRGVLTKCKNSIPPLDLLPLCLSSTKSHSPPHSLPQPHRTDPPTNKPPFKPEQAAALCAHSELRISSFHLFSEGKKTLFCINQHPCHKFNLCVNQFHIIITNSPVCTSAVKASSRLQGKSALLHTSSHFFHFRPDDDWSIQSKCWQVIF